MILAAAPLRVSLLGGGTDYPEHFNLHGGATLGGSIDKYTYVTVAPLAPLFEHRIRVNYARTELCRTVDEIQHPSVRACLRYKGIDADVQISVAGDLPARTGLGSSSSFTVALLHALAAYKGETVEQAQLAAQAVHVERELIRERVGVQDQYMTALGGIRHLQFSPRDRITATPLVLQPDRRRALQERLLMFYTGLQRTANDLLKEQIDRTVDGQNLDHLKGLHGLVADGVQVLTGGGPLSALGELLHHGWLLKKRLSGAVSTPAIDAAYDVARTAGAIGGKLLGAGGGGFLLLYVEPAQQAAVRQALTQLREVPFLFEDHGSRLLYTQGRLPT